MKDALSNSMPTDCAQWPLINVERSGNEFEQTPRAREGQGDLMLAHEVTELDMMRLYTLRTKSSWCGDDAQTMDRTQTAQLAPLLCVCQNHFKQLSNSNSLSYNHSGMP